MCEHNKIPSSPAFVFHCGMRVMGFFGVCFVVSFLFFIVVFFFICFFNELCFTNRFAYMQSKDTFQQLCLCRSLRQGPAFLHFSGFTHTPHQSLLCCGKHFVGQYDLLLLREGR